MRQEIVHAFTKQQAGLVEQIDQALNKAIEDFDFDGEIEAMAGQILKGEIEAALKRAFRDVGWDAAIRNALVQHIMKELRKEKV